MADGREFTEAGRERLYAGEAISDAKTIGALLMLRDRLPSPRP